MQNMKNIINASIQRNFLESLRKYISAFVLAFFNRKLMKPHTESLPIVHRAIPLGAKVGSRYFFADGMVHLRFSISQLQNYMTEQGVTTVHYDFSSGWTSEKNSNAITDAGTVSTSELDSLLHSFFGNNYCQLREAKSISSFSPIIVTVKQNLLEVMKKGNFGVHGLIDCFKVRPAHNMTSATTSPDFAIQLGKVVCIAPYRDIDNSIIVGRHSENSFKGMLRQYLYKHMVVYNYKQIGYGSDVDTPSYYESGYRRVCAIKKSGEFHTCPLKDFIGDGHEKPVLRSVFKVHRLKKRHSHCYESINHKFYYARFDPRYVRIRQSTHRI